MDQQKIGNFLRQLRKERNLTQEQFAEIFGVTGRTISRWEKGTNMPDLSLLVEIGKEFDLSMDEILDGERREAEMKDIHGDERREIEMDEKEAKTMEKVAEYTDKNQKKRDIRSGILFITAAVLNILAGIMSERDFIFINEGVHDFLRGTFQGFGVGILITAGLISLGAFKRVKKELLIRQMKSK